MIPIQNIIQEGYKSLAQRTLVVHDSLLPNLALQKPEIQREFDTYWLNLEQINQTGDVKKCSSNARQNFNFIIGLLEECIPLNFKPQNPTTTLAFATSAIRAYKKIYSIEELMDLTQISEFQISSGQSGLLITQSGEGQPFKRNFMVHYNPQMTAHSALVNIHDFIYALQPEQDQVYKILSDLSSIKGYRSLMHNVNQNQELRQKMMQIGMATHMLHFLNLPAVKDIATTVGVNMDTFNDFLQINIPLLDFLTCYTAGDAYLTQTDILKSQPDLQRFGVYSQVYELLSLTDAFVAQFLKPKDKVYNVGIGIVEYFRNHPIEMATIKNDPTFHQQVSEQLIKL